MGGYDTHASQRSELWRRLDELGPALAAFQRAIDALGVGAAGHRRSRCRTSNRTFRVNANDGTDHAWGSHQFVHGRRGEGRHVLRHASRRSRSAAPTTRATRASGSRRRRSTSTARRCRAGSACPPAELGAGVPEPRRVRLAGPGFPRLTRRAGGGRCATTGPVPFPRHIPCPCGRRRARRALEAAVGDSRGATILRRFP